MREFVGLLTDHRLRQALVFGGREAFSDYLVCIDREACPELFDAYLHMERTSC